MTKTIFIGKIKVTALKSRVRVYTPCLYKVWRYDAWDARAWAVVTDDPYNNGRGHIEEPLGISYSYSCRWDTATLKQWQREAEEEYDLIDVEEYKKRYSSTWKEYLMPDGQWYSYKEICRNIIAGNLMGATIIC